MWPDFSLDAKRIANALNGVDVVDIVSFGSSITPEYLLTLISHAPLGHKKLGFVGASLPGNGWSGGLNSVLLANRADWVVGGFFATVRQVGTQIQTNSISAVNLPQGIIAKLLTLPDRELTTHIGLGTFIDPRQKAGVFHLCSPQHQELGDLISLSNDQCIKYRLPASQAVLARASGYTADGCIVPETAPIDLDIPAVIKAARATGARLIIQVPIGPPIARDENAIPLLDTDVLFHAPKDLHTVGFFPARYLSDPQAIHGRTGAIVDSLVDTISPRITEAESLIVGIGYPVAVAQAIRGKKTNEINVESGNIGGVPLDGSGFGFNVAVERRISQLEMFERIWSGDIDHALLGLGMIDEQGIINIAKLGPNYNGVGGFVDISQSLRKITFCSPEKARADDQNSWSCFVPDQSRDVTWIQATH